MRKAQPSGEARSSRVGTDPVAAVSGSGRFSIAGIASGRSGRETLEAVATDLTEPNANLRSSTSLPAEITMTGGELPPEPSPNPAKSTQETPGQNSSPEKPANYEISSDENLWTSFQQGDDASYTVLYHRYADKLYSYLKVLLSSTAEFSQVDDLFQETWIRVFRERERFHLKDSGSFAGWLFRVGHNFAISALRKTRYTSSIDDVGPEGKVEAPLQVEPLFASETLTTEELMALVLKAVDQLPVMLKEVFVLSEFDKLSLDQIADTLSITKTNAKVRLYRARRAIREKLLRVLD